MRTKLSLTLEKPRVLSRQAAWGCFTTNLAVPGCGSLFAGKRVGYAQLFFTAAGFGLTVICGIATLVWFSREYPKLEQSGEETGEQLQQMWIHFRWPLLGMALFLAGFLWALMSSVGILMEAKDLPEEGRKPVPPMLGR